MVARDLLLAEVDRSKPPVVPWRPMRRPLFQDWVARLALTAGALLPYLPLLSLDRIYITDDGFTSDIFNGELPFRVLVGRLLGDGQLPVWSSELCSGTPLGPMEPISLGLFTALGVAPALSLLVITLMMVAAHGTFSLSRLLGADRSGAVLAGIAFSGSGYMVTQLKHLGIISTVVWLPWGLWFLARALAPSSRTAQDVPTALSTRLLYLGGFGLVFGEQVLSGFPQSAYIAGLLYAVWSLYFSVRVRGHLGPFPLSAVLLVLVGVVTGAGALIGSSALTFLSELSATANPGVRDSWAFASMLPYDFRDLYNFVIPYANGDISDMSYRLRSGLFWENYGYLGLLTLLLAFYAVGRGVKDPMHWLLFGIALLCMLLVLGKNTPVYYYAWKYLPGMGHFRFPTRFLVVVELMLSVLAALGLTRFGSDLERALSRVAPRVVPLLAPVVVAVTALDLFAHQSRQNPFVPAEEWLAPPHVKQFLGPEPHRARLYTPLHTITHRVAFHRARGWADLDPYREIREHVAPNTGVYFGLTTADCYMGIAPGWYVDVWGDHSGGGILMPALVSLGDQGPVFDRRLPKLLATFGVTHMIAPIEVTMEGLRPVPEARPVLLYEVSGQRARVVSGMRRVAHNEQAARIMVSADFDPDREVLLFGPEQRAIAAPHVTGSARIQKDSATELEVEVTAPEGGYLVLADTYYPGWTVTVDGTPTRLERANISVRAVALPPGARHVRFSFAPRFAMQGVIFTGLGLLLFATWFTVALWLRRRESGGESLAG